MNRARLKHGPVACMKQPLAMRAALALMLALLVGATGGHASGLSVAPVFGDGMVVQQGADLPVWGNASPGAVVSVSFAGQTRRAVADAEGGWRVVLDALPASGRGRELVVTAGGQRRMFADVLVGEVWLCAGQSNMQWPVASSVGGERLARAAAGSPTLRLLDPQPTLGLGGSVWPPEAALALTPGRYFAWGRWAGSDASAARRFSAVGVSFGLFLQEHLKVPVGLIDVAVGGTPTESWVPRGVILSDEATSGLELNFMDSALTQDFIRDRARLNLRDWSQPAQPGAMPEHPFRPGFMYAAGIEPLAGLPIAGVIWYQGESNAEDADLHDLLFTRAVGAWREAFGRDDLPVYWAQLPELNRESWPEFRASQQRLAESIPHSGMAVTIGLGHPTDVHPRDKAPVGERLARLALAQTYAHEIEAYGPTLAEHRRVGQSMQLVFDHAPRGLDLRLPGHDEPRRVQSTGFWIAGEDRVFCRASFEEQQGNTVWLSHADVPQPVAVRYGWEANTVATLFNGEGLPAAPFRTDDWDTMRVACVGDSITFGTGTGNPTSESYPAQLSRLVGPLFDVRGFGVPGASIVNGLLQPGTGWDRGFVNQPAYRRSLVFAPDVVIINLGINDVTNQAFDADRFVSDYLAMIDAYRALPSEPTVVIWHKLAPLFPGQAYYEHPRLQQIAGALDRVASQSGVATIDMATPLAGHGDDFPDKIHPNAAGAAVIASITRDKLAELGQPVAGDDP